MSKFWDIFKDVDGSFSFKRAQTTVFTILFAMIVSANLWGAMSVSDNILQLLTFLLTYGYTGIAIEKFTKRGITPINEVEVQKST